MIVYMVYNDRFLNIFFGCFCTELQNGAIRGRLRFLKLLLLTTTFIVFQGKLSAVNKGWGWGVGVFNKWCSRLYLDWHAAILRSVAQNEKKKTFSYVAQFWSCVDYFID